MRIQNPLAHALIVQLAHMNITLAIKQDSHHTLHTMIHNIVPRLTPRSAHNDSNIDVNAYQNIRYVIQDALVGLVLVHATFRKCGRNVGTVQICTCEAYIKGRHNVVSYSCLGLKYWKDVHETSSLKYPAAAILPWNPPRVSEANATRPRS